MLQVVLVAISFTIMFVVSMPNVYQFDMGDMENVKDFIDTEEDLVGGAHKGPKQKLKLKAFSYRDCGGANAMIKINTLSVTPDPLAFPGPLSVMTSFNINSNISDSSTLVGDLLMYKKVLGEYIKIPCVDNFGSCHYADMCQLIQQIQCPDELVKIGINCRCPLKRQSYMLPKTEFDVQASIIPTGDYHIVGNSTYNGMEVGCLDIVLTME